MTKQLKKIENDLESTTEEKDSLRIFTDPKLQTSIENDPVFQALANYWRPILIALAIVGAGFYGWNLYTDAQNTAREKSAEAFNSVRLKYDEYTRLKSKLSEDQVKSSEVVKTNPEKKDEEAKKITQTEEELKVAETRVKEALKSLGDVGEPYKSFQSLYLNALNPESMTKPVDWKNVKLEDAAKRLTVEIANLSYARSLLNKDLEAQKEGTRMLKELANTGIYVKSEAAVAFSKVASTPEDQAEALVILDSVKKENPELERILK